MAEQIKNPLAFVSGEDTGAGFEDINPSTIAIPFVRILQPLSPQLDKKKPEYIEGADSGDFFNTVTKKVYGDSIKVIILKFENVYVEWLPDRGGFVGIHDPENADRIATMKEFGDWRTESGNELQETYMYYALIVGEEQEGPVILSFSSSMIKAGKQLNRLITSHVPKGASKKALPYYLIVELKTEYKTNDKGSWYIPTVKLADDGNGNTLYINESQYGIIKPERLALPDKRVDFAQLEDSRSDAGPAEEIQGQGGQKSAPKTGNKNPY